MLSVRKGLTAAGRPQGLTEEEQFEWNASQENGRQAVVCPHGAKRRQKLEIDEAVVRLPGKYSPREGLRVEEANGGVIACEDTYEHAFVASGNAGLENNAKFSTSR